MPGKPSDPSRDAALLIDMRTAAHAVQSFVAGRTFEQYQVELMFRSAVERQVEIIGEAARGISEEFKLAHPEFQWRAIMAQRHRLAHQYGEIDNAIIWRVATFHVEKLIEQLQSLNLPVTEEFP